MPCCVQVYAEATATPSDGPSSSAPARNTLQLMVTGCSATALSVNAVNVVIPRPAGRSIPSVKWSADTQATWQTSIKYSDNQTLPFNVSWSRRDSITSRMSGFVVVTNPTAAAVSIEAATVRPEFGGGDAGTENTLDATCKDTTLAPGASTNCTFTGTVAGAFGCVSQLPETCTRAFFHAECGLVVLYWGGLCCHAVPTRLPYQHASHRQLLLQVGVKVPW